jgi:hypothetical protein
MTKQEINIAVAEACGLKSFREEEFPHRKMWRRVEGECYYTAYDLPDYWNDQNAIAAAWGTLTKREKFIACNHLVNDCGGIEEAIEAVPMKRCKAFLRCKGLWKET